jgi:hypothetical protein
VGRKRGLAVTTDLRVLDVAGGCDAEPWFGRSFTLAEALPYPRRGSPSSTSPYLNKAKIRAGCLRRALLAMYLRKQVMM